MPIALDIRSLSLASGVVHLCAAAAMTHVWLYRKPYPGFAWWAVSAWASFAGFTLIALRGLLPDLITVVAANTFLVVASCLTQAGLLLFVGRKPGWPWHLLLLVAFALAFTFFTRHHPSLQARIILVSLAVSILSLRTAHLALRHLRQLLGQADTMVLGSLLFVGLLYLERAIQAFSMPPGSNDFMIPSLIQGLAILTYMAGHTALSFSLLILNSQRLEGDLRASTEALKTLRGLIPICAHCKKIRDDQGDWNQLESYLREHSEASFTHGICPECAHSVFGRAISKP